MIASQLLAGYFTLGVIPFVHAYPALAGPSAQSNIRRNEGATSRHSYHSDTNDEASNDTRTMGVALLLFLLLCAFVAILFFYGKRLRHWTSRLIHPYPPEPLSPADSDESGPGFGFDGLNKSKLNAIRKKESGNLKRSYPLVKLPARPPTLRLTHTAPLPPLPPLSITHSQPESKARSQDSTDEKCTALGADE